MKNFARHTLESLASKHEVLAFSEKAWPGRDEVRAIRMNRLFLNRELLTEARRFAPDVVFYVPWTSGTPRTLLRGRVLRFASRAPVVLALTQPYDMPPLWSFAARRLLPDLVIAMEDAVVDQFRDWGVNASFVPGGVDLARFDIPSQAMRDETRADLGIEANERLILHVGHLNRRRLNAADAIALAREPRTKVLFVGSPDTPQDEGFVSDLVQAGCKVLREFLPRIERLYGAADVYWFPTTENRSSIGVPLSVLEALACGTPVVASRFGGLPRLFPSTPFVRFFSASAEAGAGWPELPPPANSGARSLVQDLDWREIGRRVETLLEQVCSGASS